MSAPPACIPEHTLRRNLSNRLYSGRSVDSCRNTSSELSFLCAHTFSSVKSVCPDRVRNTNMPPLDYCVVMYLPSSRPTPTHNVGDSCAKRDPGRDTSGRDEQYRMCECAPGTAEDGAPQRGGRTGPTLLALDICEVEVSRTFTRVHYYAVPITHTRISS